MKKKTQKIKITTKVCNYCKIEKKLQHFKKEYRERLSGKYVWYHPWCFECRNKIKEIWGRFGIPKGGNNNGQQNEIKCVLRSTVRRGSDKSSGIQCTKRTIHRSRVKRNRSISTPTNRTNRVSNNRKQGTIIKTLKKLKDAKNV